MEGAIRVNPTLYVFRDENLTAVVNVGSENGLPLLACTLAEEINKGSYLTFEIPSNHENSGRIQSGDIVVLKDMDNIFRPFMIMEDEEVHNETFNRRFYCEDLAVTELNDVVVEDVRPFDTTAEDALSRILAGSNWQVGHVDDLGIASTNVYYESVMAGLTKVIEAWGGELRFRVTMDTIRNRITGRYVDLFAQLGASTGKRFEYGKDLINVKRTIDTKQLKTALYGRGRGEETDSEGYGRRITFADVEWSVANGDPADKPLGQEWIGDPDALQVWGHLNPDGSKRHRMGVYVNEEQDDPEKLLRETWEQLQQLKQPLVTYELDVIDLEQVSADEYKHEAIRLGDTVYVIDRHFATKFEVGVRVVKIERDLIAPENTRITLGQPQGNLSDLVRRIEEQVRNKLGQGDPIGWLEGLMDLERVNFEAKTGFVYISDKDGILVTNRPKDSIDNPPDQAIQLKGGALAIANSKLPNGDWNWRTFITGEHVIADAISTGRIRTDSVEIGDDEGRVSIRGGNITIKGGSLEVYSTPDASDAGALIKGNKVITNFVKNPTFDLAPSENDWTLADGARYNPSTKRIEIDTTSGMNYTGISQYLDVYHPRATIQARYRTNLVGGSTPKNVRIYIYCWDENGNRLEDRYLTDQFSTFQEELLLTYKVEFPPGTARIRLFVQAQMSYTMTNGIEIISTQGTYDELATQDQLLGCPMDVYGVEANPQIQHSYVNITHSGLTAGNVYTGSIVWDKPFRTGPGRINVQATPYESNAGRFHVGVVSANINGCTLAIRPFQNISSGTLYVNVVAYRIGYNGITGFFI